MAKKKVNLNKKLPDLLDQIQVLENDFQLCSKNIKYPINSLISSVYSLVNRGGLLDQFSLKSCLRFKKIKSSKASFSLNPSGSNYLSLEIKNDNGKGKHSFNPIYDELLTMVGYNKIDVSEWWSKEKFWILRDNQYTLNRFHIVSKMRNSLIGAHPEDDKLDEDLYKLMFENVMQISNIDRGVSLKLNNNSEIKELPIESQRKLVRAMILQIAFELKSAINDCDINSKVNKLYD